MPNASIHTLTSNDFKIFLSKNINPNGSSPLRKKNDRERFLAWLKQEELRYFVKNSSALFVAKDNMVFWSPSGNYVKNFLRVGSIQTSRRVIDTVFFWSIPNLMGCTGIICETWSISSIALNMARLLERYGKKDGVECKVDMLSEYQDGYSGQQDIKDAIDTVYTDQGKILFLISCVMTGSSLQALKTTVEKYVRAEQSDFLTLYRLNEAVNIKSLCDYFGRPNDPKFGATRERHPGDSVISMDRHTYFPLYVKERRLRVSKAIAKTSAAFFDCYKGKNVVSVHRTVLDMNRIPGRHHGIYIDVLSLLNTDEFQKKLKQVLIKVVKRPKAIICPPHDAGLALRCNIRNFFGDSGASIVELISADLRDIASEDRDLLSNVTSDESIIIVDDVLISGSRLAQYSKRLRELNFQGKITYIIGVARPESEVEWQQRKIHLCHRQDSVEPHEVLHIESVHVPDWTSVSCPWCEELDFLDKALQDQADTDAPEDTRILVDRVKYLTNARESGGLINDVIWTVGGPPVQLTPNSIFLGSANATQADVFAAVASSIQFLRSVGNNGSKLGVSFPNANVLDPRLYLHHIFSDLILRTAIIRMSLRAELETWTDEGRRWREAAFSRLVLEADTNCCLPEFAVDVLLRRLPPPKFSPDEIAFALSLRSTNGLFFIRLLKKFELI